MGSMKSGGGGENSAINQVALLSKFYLLQGLL